MEKVSDERSSLSSRIVENDGNNELLASLEMSPEIKKYISRSRG